MSHDQAAEQIFVGKSEMAGLMRSFDWSQTPLGSAETWTQSLRSTLGICLNSRFPIAIYWGEDCLLLYNDAWRPIVGDKHPWAIGRPAREVWSEIWDDIGPELASVLATGEGISHNDELLSMHRFGYTEECFFEYTFNPIQGQGGAIEGVFNVVTETTYRVLNERRARLLREAAAKTGSAKTAEELCALMVETFRSNPFDIPFALLYLVSQDGKSAQLSGSTELVLDSPISPAIVDLTENQGTDGWSIALAVRTAQPQIINDLPTRFGALPGSPWAEPPQEAMVLPVSATAPGKVAGVLVAVASPRRKLDDNYRNFLNQVAGQMALALSNVHAYEAERQRAEALAELDRAKTTFFSNVSHELRTPLTLMLNPLQDALEGLEKWESGRVDEWEGESETKFPLTPRPLDPSTLKQPLQLAYRNSQRLLKLVNTLLDFSRIEAGRIQAVYEPIDLATLTADLAGVFRSAIERVGMRLQVDCPPLPEPIYVDREMWEKIVLNLLSNAFKFTFEGEIAVSLSVVDDQIELEVRDTGTGIPAEELPRIFERFHQVRGARGRSYEGSGIGLALVQELVKLHGGTIRVDSVVDQGTCFTVAIPTGYAHLPSERIGTTRTLASTATIATTYVEEALRWLPEGGMKEWESGSLRAWEGDENSPPLTHPPINSSTHLPKLLLADDNADMRDYLKRLLGQRYAVETVADGVAALAAIRRQLPDLVLTDVMMPRMDGFGLLQALRADPQTQELPIVLLSARSGEEARIEGLAAGADDYLIKPFSARELLARLEATLKLAQLRRDAAQREQALQQEAENAKQTAETVLSSISDGFFTLDRHWCYTYANDRLCEMAGKSRSELLGHNQWELFPDTVDTDVYLRFHQAMREQTPLQFEYFYLPWKRWFEYRVYPSPNGLTIFAAEVTAAKHREAERKRARQALRESESRFRLIVESAREYAIFTLDLNNLITSWNSGAERLLGYQEAEIIGCSGRIIFTPEDNEQGRSEQELQIALAQGRSENKRWHVRKNSSRFWGSGFVMPLRDEADTVQGFIKIMRDETAQRQAEEQFQLLYDTTSDLLATEQPMTLMHNLFSKLSAQLELDYYYNCMVEEKDDRSMLHLRSHEGISEAVAQSLEWIEFGQYICGLVAQEQRQIVLGQTQISSHPNAQLLSSMGVTAYAGQPLIVQGRLLGTLSFASRSRTHFTPEEANLLQLVCDQMAIALERSNLLNSIQQQAEELQRANQIKDEFLAVLSHELRSPLNPILGWTQLLQNGKLDAARQQEALATIERNAKLQTQLIEDLLDISRIMQGKLSLTVAPVSLSFVISAALEAVQLAAEAKQIRIELDLDSAIAPVLGDAARLQQVVWNLLSNAVKFTPQSGQVTVELRQLAHLAQIRVVDTGKGIASDFLPHVFEYFRQEDGSTTRKFGGLGLGLAIARQIVEMHGGTIWAESQGENQGATFVVQLPVTSQAAPIAAESARTQADAKILLNNVQILLVDDEPDTREFQAFVLEQSGAKVTAVASGLEALQVLNQCVPDVLVSDVGMAEMDGYMLMQQIRLRPIDQGRNILAIALTAYAAEVDQQKALQAGFQAHVTKPVEPETLVKAIANLLHT